jgi:5-methylcytosine-specific restriction endonuclease McrBC regulatory subunit McrC
MYRLKYKLAALIVKLQRFFYPKNSFKNYEFSFLLEDIYDEEYKESICKQMNRNWN